MSLFSNHNLLFAKKALPLGFSNLATFEALSTKYYQNHDRFPNYPTEPGCYYNPVTKETITSTCKPWASPFNSYAGLLRYSALYGHYPAFIDVGEKQSDIDRHLTPSLMIGDNFLHVIQEDSHIGNIDHFKVDMDFSKSVKANTVTGLYSRLQPRKTGVDQFQIICQYNDSSIHKIPFDGTSFGTPFEVITSSRRAYPCMCFGQMTDKTGKHFVPFALLNAAESAYNAKILLTTYDYNTWYNVDGSHAFTGNVNATALVTLADKWVYIGDYSDASGTNLNLITSCIDNDGNFFDITIVSGTNKVKTTTFNGTAWVYNECTLAQTIADFSVTGLPDSAPIVYCFKRAGSIYALVRVVDGSWYKYHMIKSNDIGASWTDLGDVTPGVNQHIYRAAGPINVNEIPSNTNFPIYSSKYDFDNSSGKNCDFYMVEAAFGNISATGPLVYNTAFSAVTDFPNAVFGYESDSVTGSAPITAIADKTGNGNTPTMIGSPGLTSGEIVLNGTSSALQINAIAAAIAAHDKFTLFFYGRSSGVTGGFLTLSKSTDNNMFAIVATRNSATDDRRLLYNYSPGSAAFIQNGIDPALSGNNLYVVTCDGRSIRWRINGREQNKRYNTGSLLQHLGKWGTGLTTPNRVGIGVLQRSSNAFYPLTFSSIIYASSCYSTIDLMKGENYYKNKYSATIDRF